MPLDWDQPSLVRRISENLFERGKNPIKRAIGEWFKRMSEIR